MIRPLRKAYFPIAFAWRLRILFFLLFHVVKIPFIHYWTLTDCSNDANGIV